MKKILFFLFVISFLLPAPVRTGEVEKSDWGLKEFLSPPPLGADLDNQLPDQEAAAEKKKPPALRKSAEEKPAPVECQPAPLQIREGAVTGVGGGGPMAACEVLPSARLIDDAWDATIASGQTTTVGTITEAPAAPAPLSPSDAATLAQENVGFTWADASGASSYRIQVSRDPDFAAPVIDAATASASYTTGAALGSSTYFWRVQATDAFDNSSEWSPAWSFTIDAAPPANTTAAGFINHGMVSTNTATVTLAISAEKDSGVAAYAVSENSARPAADSSRWVNVAATTGYSANIPYTLSSGEGTKTIYVWFKDAFGHVSKAARDTILFDTTPPATAITHRPANPTNSTSAELRFASPEAGSSFQCSLDSGAYTVCVSPQSYAGLTAGPHTVDIKATDAAGNADPEPAHYTWTIDTVPPDTTITGRPTDPTNSFSADFGFVSTEAGSTFRCSLDGGAYVACAGSQSYADLAAGPHTVAVSAIDAAGNADPVPARYAWTIDITPPDTVITAHPANSTNSTSADFVFSSSEAGSTFKCRLDDNVYTACTSTHSYAGLPPGPHTFTVRATDAVGNADPIAARFAWTIDTVPPDTAIPGRPPDRTNSTSADFSFASTEGGVTFRCSLDSGPYAACAIRQSYPGLAAGAHTIEVKASDAAGNTDPIPARYTWTIDLTPPDTAITIQPAETTNATGANFSFSSTKAGSTFECRIDDGVFTACSNPHSYAGLAAGPHTFAVRAKDAVGNIDPTAAGFAWAIDTAPPDTEITDQPDDPSSTVAAGFSFDATEDGSTFQCSLDGGEYTACASPQSYARLAAGPHTFTVRAADAVGNTDKTPASFTWTANEPPINSTPAGFVNKTGAYYTHGKSVKLSIAAIASGDRGVKAYFASESPVTPDPSDPGWITVPQGTAYSRTVNYTLSDGNGKKTVYVWFKDADGMVSDVKSDTIYYFSAEPFMLVFLLLQLALIF